MITIYSVSGSAAVMDETSGTCLAPTPGMELQKDRVWIIVTGQDSRVHLLVNGAPFDLPPQSEMRLEASKNGILDWINRQRPYSKHTRNWSGSLKLLVGKVWEKAKAKDREGESPNAVVGVRG